MTKHDYLILFPLVLALAACGSGKAELTAAPGVAIDEIAIYQSIKRTLVKGGKPVTSKIPLVAQRAAMIRVYGRFSGGYDKKEVTARLTFKGQEPLETKGVLGTTDDGKLESTLNFYPPASYITSPLEFSLELLQERTEKVENPQARFPAEGTQKFSVEGKKNTFRLVVVPFAYKADGSGRLPDLSKAQVQKFKERFLQLYPVSDAEITVHKAIDWTKAIAGNGAGWQEVGMRLMQVRTESKIPDETYLYGIFNPAATLIGYCGFGCMLGVTLLNNQPPDKGMVQLRLALGVGFSERAADTMAHEIGHSHGRAHANCGPGLMPNSIDPDYPTDSAHSGGKIGIWGFGIFSKKLIPPTYTDIMGYCDNKWVSDHNYIAFHKRGQNVNAAYWHQPAGRRLSYDMVAVDAQGNVRWGRPITRQRPLAGAAIPVILDGQRTVSGAYFRFDHMPGGWLFVPRSGARRADFVVNGRTHRAER